MIRKWFSRKRLLCPMASLVLLLSACGPFIVPRSGFIREISWDDKSNALLFLYSYNKSELKTPMFIFDLYKLAFSDSSQTPPEKVGQFSQDLIKNSLAIFQNSASKSYISENKSKITPSEQGKPIDPYLIHTASFHKKHGFILIGHTYKTSRNTAERALSIIDISSNTVRDVQVPDDFWAHSPAIMWTGFEDDVLVEYTKNSAVYHAVGTIDLDKKALTNLKTFKTYSAKSAGGKGEFFYSADQDQLQVIVLGFENKDTVYFLEKAPFSKQAALVKLDIASGNTSQLATIDTEKSYYPYLRTHDQISISQRKVAFNTNQKIVISNLDGTGQRQLLDLSDLPPGGPYYGPQ